MKARIRGLASHVRRFGLPIIVTAAIFLPAFVAQSPLRDAATGAPVTAVLRLPLWYSLLAPISDLFDAITLLSVRQHSAVVATLVTLYGAVRVWSRRRGSAPRPSVPLELSGVAALLAGVVALNGAAAVIQRPMAKLVLRSSDELAVDFHSHTNASQDARGAFTVGRNSAWHDAAGFDVVFITDHMVSGAHIGSPSAAREASGSRPVLLFGIERACHGSHFVILGDSTQIAAAPCGGPLEADGESSIEGPEPASSAISILALPDDGLHAGMHVDAQGIELVDAAPRGLDQLDQFRGVLLGTADRSRVALVSGSNNHGWGRTVAAWNVMTIPGWRAMSRSELESAILQRFRTDPRNAVRVIERRRAAAGASPVTLVLTGPSMAVNMARTMSTIERIMWVAWIWWGCALAALVRHARRRLLVRGAPRVIRGLGFPAWQSAEPET